MSSFVEIPDEESERRKKPSYNSYVEQREKVLSSSLEGSEEQEAPKAEKKTESLRSCKKSRIWPAVFSIIGLFAFFVLAQVWMKDATLQGFVVTGNEIIQTSEVTGQLKELLGKRLDEVKLSDIEKEIGKMQYAGKVIATKELPGNIRIRIEERQPIAIAHINGEIRFISEDGILLDYAPQVLQENRLPMLSGFQRIRKAEGGNSYLDSAEVSAAISLLLAVRESKFAQFILGEVNVSNPKKLYGRTTGARAKFIFGDKGNFEEKLHNMEIFWKQVVTKKGVKNFDYVDLRFDGKIFAQ